jgi:hypothetical protein
MAATATKIAIDGLGKAKLAALREQAKTLGMSAEGYALQLIEDGLLLEQRRGPGPLTSYSRQSRRGSSRAG